MSLTILSIGAMVTSNFDIASAQCMLVDGVARGVLA
jgi:hypothetical protein